MECSNCFKSQEKFIKKVTEFHSRKYLVEFILRIIFKFTRRLERLCTFCTCEMANLCSACIFYQMCKDDQYKIYQNSFDYNFLEEYHFVLFNNFSQFLKDDSHFVCLLIK